MLENVKLQKSTYIFMFVLIVTISLKCACSSKPIAVVKLTLKSSTFREWTSPFDIRNDLSKKLVKGGFKVIPEKSEAYDATILLDYKEAKYGLYKIQGLSFTSGYGTKITCKILVRSNTGETLYLQTIQGVTKGKTAKHGPESYYMLAIKDFKKSVHYEYFEKILATKFGTEDEVLVLIRALESNVKKLDKVKTAQEAAESLGHIRDKRAVEPLIEAVDRGYIRTKIAAIRALSKIGDAKAVSPIIKQLSYFDDNVKIEAARALGWLGDPKAIPSLEEVAKKNRNVKVQTVARMALAKINKI